MKKLLVVLSGLTAAVAGAQTVHLRCVTEGIQPGTTYEAQVVINVDQNVFRLDGETLGLVMTDDIYGAVSRLLGRPSSKRVIDRKTGEITVTYFDGPDGPFDRKGSCEKVEPPLRKF
jgi:hypothetical protein